MTEPTMHETHIEETYRGTHPRVAEYHVEPDWWSRMMALGSMLVAAAALWFARHPDSTLSDLKPVGVASVAGMLDSSDDAAPETSDTTDPAAKDSAMSHALATSEGADPSDDKKKETTVLRASNANELLDESESDDELDVFGDETDRTTSTLEEFIADSGMVDVPEDNSDQSSDENSSSVAADQAPQLKDEKSDELQWDGFREEGEGLLVVRVYPQPLASEYAVTMTVRNTSDQLAVVSRVLFQPREIIENVSTSLASRSFGVSSPSEMALAFEMDDNRAEAPESQGRYVHELLDTFQIPADSAVDIRLAIQNDEHLGYGLRGKLTLEYNVDQSLDVENTPVAFITDQDE